MDLTGMTAEDLATLLEAAQAELAGRQTRDAIVRDVTGAVDPIIRENRALLGEAWQEGRLSWDGHCIRVEDPGDEPAPTEPVSAVAAETTPDPVPYEVGDDVPAGASIEWGGQLLRVVTGHQRTSRWNPHTKPGWFEAVDDA